MKSVPSPAPMDIGAPPPKGDTGRAEGRQGKRREEHAGMESGNKKKMKADIAHIKDFRAGLITDNADYPINSVYDCLNLDFRADGTERRMPYHYQQNLSAQFTGYTILGLYQKTFTDSTGATSEVLICVVKNVSSGIVKIWVNKYYSPSTTYGNQWYATAGWQAGWTELTESITATIDSVTTPGGHSGQYVTFESNATMLLKAADYYKGWFAVASGKIIGQVTKFQNEDTTSEFWIARGNKIKTDVSEPLYSLELHTAVDGDDLQIVRFPVNYHNGAFFGNTGSITTGFTTATFEEVPNGVKITCGTTGRVLWLGYISAKTFFGDAGNMNSGDYEFKPAWDGLWLGFDIPDIKNKNTMYWASEHGAVGGDTTHDPALADLDIYSIVKDVGAGTPERRTNAAANYVNCYYKDDYDEIGMLLKLEVSQIKACLESAGAAIIEKYWVDNIQGLALEISGYQAFYIRYYGGQPCTYTTPSPAQRWINSTVPTLICNPDFDRRITASLLFYGKGDNDLKGFKTSWAVQDIMSYQLSDSRGGRVEHTSNKWNIDGTNYNYYLELELYNGGDYTTDPFMDYPENSGLSMNSYLNMNFYKDIWIKAEKLIKIGNDIIAIGLSDDSVSTEAAADKNGKFKIALSAIQGAGGNNADSVFSDERVRQITLGEPLLCGASLTNGKFLLFTGKSCYYYTYADNTKGIIKQEKEFQFRGTYGGKTIVKAQYGDQFAGVYWVGKSSIYRFLDNHPEDILYGRWRKTFETFTEAQKAAAILGVLPRTMDVFVVIASKVYVWSIKEENWKIYGYTNLPAAIINSIDEEMYFLSSNLLFKTATPAEALITAYDTINDSDKVDITILLHKKFINGSRESIKNPYLVELEYNAGGSTGTIEYNAGVNTATNDILKHKKTLTTGYMRDTMNIVSGFTKTDGGYTFLKMRKPGYIWDLKIITAGDNTTPKLKHLQIDELIAAAVIREKGLNR